METNNNTLSSQYDTNYEKSPNKNEIKKDLLKNLKEFSKLYNQYYIKMNKANRSYKGMLVQALIKDLFNTCIDDFYLVNEPKFDRFNNLLWKLEFTLTDLYGCGIIKKRPRKNLAVFTNTMKNLLKSIK